MNILDTLSGALTTDVLIILTTCVALFCFALFYGKSRAVGLLISVYVGIIGFLSFPFLEEATLLKSSEAQTTLSHIGLFAVGVFIIYTVIQRFIYVEYPASTLFRFIHAGIIAASTTALLFAFAYHTIPVGTLYDFNQTIDHLFSSEYFFWWLVAPLGGLFFVSRGY